jgi:subtilisin family serine protease
MNSREHPHLLLKRQPTRKPLVFGGLLFTMVFALIAFAPGSGAIHPNPRPQTQTVSSEKRRRPEFVPGDVLVRFRKDRAFEGTTYVTVPGERPGETLAAPPERVVLKVERFDGSNIVDGLRFAHVAPEQTMKAIEALNARDDVLYAEPNYIRHLDTPPPVTPNDPLFPQLYGLNTAHIDAQDAWNLTTGSSNIVVGVIDEGIDVNHPDLAANIWTNPGEIPGNGVDDDGNGFIDDVNGWDFAHNDNHVFDLTTGSYPPPAGYKGDIDDHATHVAGTIGAAGNNGIGVVGVNWQVKLMSLKFIRAVVQSNQTVIYQGDDADALRAYNYAKQMRDLWLSSGGTKGANIHVLNGSFGGSGYSQSAFDALNALGQSGILFVGAAGNESSNSDLNHHYPSDYALPNVMSIAATDSTDQLASFSNFGSQSVLMGAPGSNILSTTPLNTYRSFSGTSMAAPHVSGAAALLCAANPNLSPAQLRALLAFNGDLVSALANNTLTGRRLNVFTSLQALNENDTTPPGQVRNFEYQPGPPSRSLTATWIASGDDGAAGQASLYSLGFTDKFSGAVVPLRSIIPAASGSSQGVTVNIPYRHTSGKITLREFDNVGNEGTTASFPVNLDRSFTDPYATSLGSPAALSTGGAPLSFNCDDCFKTANLPFSFSFFGSSFNSVTISSNGNIYFVPPTPPTRPNGDADDVPGSTAELSRFKMISGLWDDLDLSTSRRADSDVFMVQPDSSHVIFRWQGVQFGDGTNGGPVNFEIELNSNGTIKTRYGAGNVNVFPVVGISGGEPDVYTAVALTSELSPITLTNAQTAVFTPRNLVPLPAVQFSLPAYSVTEGTADATVTVTRTGDITSTASASYATSDAGSSQNCNPPSNGLASARCDFTTTVGTVLFAPGESSKNILIPIVDDSYAEGTETFTISLSNSSGATLGSPTTATITINDNSDGNGANPIDSAGFFVRQHYLDFLNREPDGPGFGFWTNNITSCGSNQSCTEVKRIDTSAAFFLSIEFQDTGYLVYRIYKAAYGNMPNAPVPIKLEEFLPDTQEIGIGVVVGQGNWQQILEDNKQAFALEFVQRSRFRSAYPSGMTPTQFVTQLFANAGVTPTSAEQNAAVNEFGGAVIITNAAACARALRDVAENATLRQQEFNRAFVLMQYFGYLRRNPYDPPEMTLDYSGYNFWLNKLNTFGNYVNAEMVKSFIVSGEYRQRFGP